MLVACRLYTKKDMVFDFYARMPNAFRKGANVIAAEKIEAAC